ncbi:MsnO8 family LLM class oxidoreductase [Nocardiopsis quinghaiensis]|uniref:MsnO8 family LLM class oxidoreductase n=1 Tax=Nocardiopsis quinghaiensis TaxID=464995 RepID=UPI001238F339|nr:MsnO8 family LLM class oxidoreductase [Nocardiopsis quinghaiensis]
MTQPRLSILDQSPVGEGFSAADALEAGIRTARAAERLGYHRYWVAEHHASPGFAGAAPEILASVLLARTDRIRIGTGGVLLPRYPAEKVAEVFATLATLFPGRVDMGIGRAGGPADRFPEQLAELLSLLGMSVTAPGTRTVTARPELPPPLWLLGGGTGSAQLAGLLGCGFAFAHFLDPRPAETALDSYRSGYERARGHRAPGGVLAVRAVTADTSERAEELVQAMLLWRARKDLGLDLPIPSAQAVRDHAWTPEERQRASVRRSSVVSGTPVQVRDRLVVLAKEHGVDELMVNTLTCDSGDRLRSYELLAEAFGLDGDGRGGA